MKKILALVACLSLVASLAIGGSIAYLTDRDSEANVFTIGDVSIDLHEEYEPQSELLPNVKIEKEATITNTGANAAYVWMTVAIPSVLDNANGDASTNPIHWNIPGAFWYGYHTEKKYIDSAIEKGYLPAGSGAVEDGKTWLYDAVDMKSETIDGKTYNLYTLLYNSAIEPKETTNIGLNQVYMDAYVDINTDGEMYRVYNGEEKKLGWNVKTNGNPTIYVSAYAIQKEGFGTPIEAYNAYNTQWGSNGTEYGKPSTPENPGATNVVKNADELEAALASVAADGGSIIFGADITVDDTMAVNSDTVINLNGYDLDASNNNGNLFNIAEDSELTINAQNAEIKFGAATGVSLTDADLTINGGNFVGIDRNFITVNGDEAANITLNDVKFQSSSNGWVVYPNSSGEINVVVNGGEFEAGGGIFMTDGVVKDAKITATNGGNGWPAVYGAGNTTIENCEIVSKGHAVSVDGGNTITVNSSKVTAPADKLAFQVYSSGGTINVNNTTYTGMIGTTGPMKSGCTALIFIDGEQAYIKK